MITFFRMGTPLAGKRKDAAEYAKKISTYISENHGVECSAAIRIGGPSGRCGIRLVFDNMAGLEAWIDKARADDAYVKATEGAATLMDGTEDAVWKVL
jgi:hypothetical protein